MAGGCCIHQLQAPCHSAGQAVQYKAPATGVIPLPRDNGSATCFLFKHLIRYSVIFALEVMKPDGFGLCVITIPHWYLLNPSLPNS